MPVATHAVNNWLLNCDSINTELPKSSDKCSCHDRLNKIYYCMCYFCEDRQSRSRALDNHQNHQPQTRSFPRQGPQTNTLHLMAKDHHKQRPEKKNRDSTYHPACSDKKVEMTLWQAPNE